MNDSNEEKLPPDVITSDTENDTTINPEEAPPHKRAKFRRLRAYNTGAWNGPKRENKELIYQQDNLHRFDSLSSSLNLTGYQQRRGRKLMDEIDFRERGLRVDLVIFALCVLITNEDVDGGIRYYPNDSTVTDQVFERVAESIDFEENQQAAVIERLRSSLNFE